MPHSLIFFGLCSVRRLPAVVIIGALSFTIGLASALDVSIFVNQDAVWAHALILSGCFLIFLVIRYNPLKFRKNIYNNVRGATCTLTTLTSSSSSVVWHRGLANATAVVDYCRVSYSWYIPEAHCLSLLPLHHTFACRFVCPLEGLGMLVWWVVDEIRLNSDAYSGKPFWTFTPTSLICILTQVRINA